MKSIRLYRGLRNKFNPCYGDQHIGTPCGYTCWTDSVEYAREYGEYIYYVDIPIPFVNMDDIFDCYGDRSLCFWDMVQDGYNIYCIYEEHDDYQYLEIFPLENK